MGIRGWFTHKARSERGASLSMALLVALVCVVVASIVLSAATAVSGRQHQLKEMERSYYNVTSAARLFWDEMTESNDGLAVNITRGCNAQKNGSEWDGWYLKIDSSENKSAVGGEGSADTLFQIASFDLVMNSSGNLSFTDSREVNASTIKNSFDVSGSEPKPKPVSNVKTTYGEFKLQGESPGKKLEEVWITVTRNDDQTFNFEFREKGESSYVCTLTALVWPEGGSLSHADDGIHLEWITTVTWKPINMAVGIVGDAS